LKFACELQIEALQVSRCAVRPQIKCRTRRATVRAEFLLDRLLAQTEDVDASVGFAVPTVACADRTDPDLVNGGSGTRIVSAALRLSCSTPMA